MDKYEFNLKVEQLRKMVAASDYTTAMKIADSIDWRRVRNVGLLTTVSEVYEKNRDYTEAKNVLLNAYDCAPSGRGILYKLTILALEEGSVSEAEAYYKEFYSLASDDSRQHILRYLILKEKHAPIDQMIHSLESYNSIELNERWMYELAELYHEAGESEKCISMCDKLMLMFGIGKYVDKAIELKKDKEGVALTSYQQGLIDNRDMYEEKLREVQEEYASAEPEEEYSDDEAEPTISVTEDNSEDDAEMSDEIAAHIRGLEEQEKIKEELKDQPIDVDDKTGTDKTKIYGEGNKPEEETDPEDIAQAPEENHEEPKEEPKQEEPKQEEPQTEVKLGNYNIVEGKNAEDGVKQAVDVLKKLHEQTGSTNPVAKISASKLNARGLMESLPKIEGKDLLIDKAGDLDEKTASELIELISSSTDERAIVLADNPRQLTMLAGKYPKLFEAFGDEKHLALAQEADEDTAGKQQDEQEHTTTPVSDETQQDDTQTDENSDEDNTSESETQDSMGSGTRDEIKYNTEEMGLDEFAEYAAEYAKSIDCSISGKSMLALYERIEVMEEDNIPLTRKNAEDLIEDAADRAEKPPIGAKLKGLFSAKYDKDGMLILREEHFIV